MSAPTTTIVFLDDDGDEFPVAVARGAQPVERATRESEQLVAEGAWRPTGALRVRCGWYAACENAATGTRSHPILDEVPICDRCRAKVEAL